MKISTCCTARPDAIWDGICSACKEHADFEDTDCVYCCRCEKVEVSEPGDICGECRQVAADHRRELSLNR
jgi:hypothetical protein